MRPDLGPTQAALSALGNPERKLSVVHVAGTVGKGSTAALIAAGLQAAGLRTGLYTSPHLSRFTERIRMTGHEIARDELVEFGCAVERVAPDLTLFETATVLALLYFRERAVDVAVIETGLGGRLDATNVVMPRTAVLTPIGFDHAEVLGPDLVSIAREKAGILKAGARWFSGPQAPEALAAFPAGVQVVNDTWEGTLSLAGFHQRQNAALAAVVLRSWSIPEPTIAQAFSLVRWPGRFERIGPMLLDCAHNVPAASALSHALASESPMPVIFGCLADKDAAGMIKALAPCASRWIFVRPRSDRAQDPARLRTLVSGSVVAPSLREAFTHVTGPALVTGSTYLVGEARELLLCESADPISISDVTRLMAHK